MYRYLETQIDESEIESLPQLGKEMLEVLSKNSKKFRTMLYGSNESTYYKIPILKYIEPKEFFEIFMTLRNEEKRFVILALDKRYEFIDSTGTLCEEIDFLNQLNLVIIHSAAQNKGRVSP